MKQRKTPLILAALFTLLIFSCSDDNETQIEQGITELEAAEEVGISLSTDVSTYVADAYELTIEAENSNSSPNGRTTEICGVSLDTTFTKSYTGPNVSFEVTLSYGYSFSCNELNIPTSFTAGYSSEHTRSGVRLESSGSSEGTLTATDLQPSASSYVVNGNYAGEKNISSKVDSEKSFSSSSTAALVDITINKSTLQVESGTATYILTGNNPRKGDFSYEATVVFNGDGSATITINGEVFTVNLRNGEVD